MAYIHETRHHHDTDPVCNQYIQSLHMLRLKQNGQHFAGNISRCIYIDEKVSILIHISLKFFQS